MFMSFTWSVFFLGEDVSAPIKMNENKRCLAAFITQIRVNSLGFFFFAISHYL